MMIHPCPKDMDNCKTILNTSYEILRQKHTSTLYSDTEMHTVIVLDVAKTELMS